VLLSFIIICLLLIPLIGLIWPKLVPFLIAYRPYAGNWRWSYHIVSKKAENKMNKLKTPESVFLSKNMEELIGHISPNEAK